MQTIPEIYVSAINYPVFAIDFDVGFTGGPSTITIDFKSEDGEYNLPELNVHTPVTIQIGDKYVYNYYAVSRRYTDNPRGGKTLTVKFKDKSILLDRTYVGLKNKHGYQSKFPLLIVGKEVDPCANDVLQERNDPCDPCGASQALIDCAEERRTSVLDVRYNFNDLLDAVEAFSPEIKIKDRPPRSAFNDRFFERYTGTLRSVLENWAGDYGFTFFWENDELNFLDLRQGFEINTKGIENEKEIIDYSHEETLEGTVSNGFVAHYAQDQKVLQYGCGGSSYTSLVMAPIELADIINPARLAYYNTDSSARIPTLEFLSQLSYYSLELRDMYVMKQFYGINTAADASAYIGAEAPLRLLGNMVIKKVYHRGSVGSDRVVYQMYVENYLSLGTKETAVEASATLSASVKRFLEEDGFFMLVDVDQEVLDKLHNFEKNLAEKFLGKYFIRRTTRRSKHISWSAPEGDNIQFYENDQDNFNSGTSYLINFPFAQFMNGNNLNVLRPILGGAITTDGEQTFPNSTFLLLERNPSWNPLSSEDQSVFDFLSKVNLFAPKEIEIMDIKSIREISTEKSKMLMMQTFDFNATSRVASNTYEQGKKNTQFTDSDYPVAWGLRDARCRHIDITISDVGANFKIQGPAQGYSAQGSGNIHGGYVIIGNNESNTATRTITKKELVISDIPEDENTLSTFVNIKEIAESLISVVSDQCEISDAEIINLAREYIQELKYSIDQPIETLSLTFAGIPDQGYSIRDGIESFSVRIGESGVETNLVFSNKQKSKISENLLLKNFQSLMEQYSRTRNYIKSPRNVGNTVAPDPLGSGGSAAPE